MCWFLHTKTIHSTRNTRQLTLDTRHSTLDTRSTSMPLFKTQEQCYAILRVGRQMAQRGFVHVHCWSCLSLSGVQVFQIWLRILKHNTTVVCFKKKLAIIVLTNSVSNAVSVNLKSDMG